MKIEDNQKVDVTVRIETAEELETFGLILKTAETHGGTREVVNQANAIYSALRRQFPNIGEPGRKHTPISMY